MNSLESIERMLFGPLDSSYCLIFYVFTVLLFISLVSVTAKSLYDILFSKKNVDMKKALTMLSMIAQAALMYFTQRLLYSMCVKTDL